MQSPFLERRAFFRLCAACSAFLARPLSRSAKATPPPAPQTNRSAVKNRQNYVAIQIKPYEWIDEGINQVLDNIQQNGAINNSLGIHLRFFRGAHDA